MMRTAHFLTLAALTASCASAPRSSVEVEYGLVRAGTVEQAQFVADALAFTPRVRDTLEATRNELPELWIVERDLGGLRAICYERRIELSPIVGEYHVLHELVHWYMPGSAFDGLPHFVEEGLCDFVALDMLGMVEGRRREHDTIERLTVPLASLDVNSRNFVRLPGKTRENLTRLGFEVVSRLGLDRVRALVAVGTSPLGYIEDSGIEFREGPRSGQGTAALADRGSGEVRDQHVAPRVAQVLGDEAARAVRGRVLTRGGRRRRGGPWAPLSRCGARGGGSGSGPRRWRPLHPRSAHSRGHGR
jgi:hypothetical protein